MTRFVLLFRAFVTPHSEARRAPTLAVALAGALLLLSPAGRADTTANPPAASAPADGATDATIDAAAEAIAELERARQQLEEWTRRSSAAEAQAYCEHVHAARQSDGALLRSPWLAAHASTLQRGELSDTETAVTPRLRAGVGWSMSDWLRADLLAKHAERSCQVYRAELQLPDGDYDVDAVSIDGWKDKVQVLRQALTESEKVLAQSERDVQIGERTVTTHLSVLTAHQRLLEALADAQTRVARLSVVTPPTAAVPEQLAALRQGVIELERVEGQLRRNRALSLEVEGGYDEIIGMSQALPAYAQLSVTFRPGYFWQPQADETSARSRASAAAERAIRAQSSLQRTRLSLQGQTAPLQIEAARLQALITTLERQAAVLSAVPSAQALEMVQRLWFELQLRRAELAQVDGSLRAIQRWSEQHRDPANKSSDRTSSHDR